MTKSQFPAENSIASLDIRFVAKLWMMFEIKTASNSMKAIDY